jgi:hypothetical protein
MAGFGEGEQVVAGEESMEPVTWPMGGSRRRRASEVADLPEPDSPTRPRVSPGLIWKEMVLTAGWWLKAMDKSLTSRSVPLLMVPL